MMSGVLFRGEPTLPLIGHIFIRSDGNGFISAATVRLVTPYKPPTRKAPLVDEAT